MLSILRPIKNPLYNSEVSGNGNIVVTVDAADVNATDNTISTIQTLNPSGYIGCPFPNTQAYIVNSAGSQYLRMANGFLNVMPSNAPTLLPGESMNFTSGWYIKYGVDSVKFFSEATTATAINGEFTGQMMLNRINELESNIQYLTTLVQQLQSHSHPNNGQAPSQTFTKPTTPSTLAKDSGYISNGNYLIGANSINYGG